MSLRKIFSKTPIFGTLLDARGQDFSEARTEVWLNVAASTIPIWFGPLLIYIPLNQEHSLTSLVLRNLSNGEMYLYAVALLTPLCYLILKETKDAPSFPHRMSLGVVSGAIILLAAGLFAVGRVNTFILEQYYSGTDEPPILLNDESFFIAALVIYGFSVVIVYTAYVYKNYHVSGGAASQRTDTHRFSEEFKGRNRG